MKIYLPPGTDVGDDFNPIDPTRPGTAADFLDINAGIGEIYQVLIADRTFRDEPDELIQCLCVRIGPFGIGAGD